MSTRDTPLLHVVQSGSQRLALWADWIPLLQYRTQRLRNADFSLWVSRWNARCRTLFSHVDQEEVRSDCLVRNSSQLITSFGDPISRCAADSSSTTRWSWAHRRKWQSGA